MHAVVGVVGGGQLARMMIPPAVALGLELRVLAEAEASSASLAATAIGDCRDRRTVTDFAAGLSVMTFDHEHVPQEVLADVVALGVPVRPGPQALAVAQDKITMRKELARLGLPIPDWAIVTDASDLGDFLSAHGGAAVVKRPRGGYDGKGVRVIRDATEAYDWLSEGALLVEEFVTFRRELAQLIARRPAGDTLAWQLVETVQRDGVCVEVVAPAPESDVLQSTAQKIAAAVAEGLGVTGVLAVELFETPDGRLLINELAMRPHNSGHWTIDGAVTSQFEQHLRAVVDLPLGDPSPRARWSVMVNILGGPSAGMADRYPEALAAYPDVKVHSYAKPHRLGRKVGHVTASGDDLETVRARARAAAALFEA